MNSPNHENIDYWLFERIEGNLTPEQEQQLSLFLLLNPEYDLDADAWEQTILDIPSHPMPAGTMDFAAPANKKRKKRTLFFWFSASLSLFMIAFFTGDNNVAWQFENLFANKNNRIKNNTTHRDGLNNQGNINGLATYSQNSNMTKDLTNTIAATNENNDLLTSPLIESTLTPTLSNSASIFSESNNPAVELPLHLSPIKLLQQNNDDLEIVEDLGDVDKNKKSNKVDINLHLSKSSGLYKFLKKENVSASVKDRVLCLQELSNLDVSESFAGNRSQTRIQSTSFARWYGQANQKLSQQISFDTYARNLKSGFGAVANYVDFGNGTIKEWNLRLIYSPKIALGKLVSIEPSVSYQFGEKSINASKVTSNGMFEYSSMQPQQFHYNMNNPIGQQLYYRDLNSSVVLNVGPVYAGFRASNLLKHQDNVHTNFYDTIQRASSVNSVILGTDFSARNGDIVFSPMIMHQFDGAYAFTQLSASCQFKQFMLGANFGSNQSFGALIGIQTKNFSVLAQSFKNKGFMNNQGSFMHQLTLRFNTNISRKTRRYLYL